MRLLLFTVFVMANSHIYSQENFGWIAPEGFTLNTRTINWEDFKGQEDKEMTQQLASRNLYAAAYVCPAIYFFVDGYERTPNGRIKFAFRTKCAFQSRAFVVIDWTTLEQKSYSSIIT